MSERESPPPVVRRNCATINRGWAENLRTFVARARSKTPVIAREGIYDGFTAVVCNIHI